MPTYRTDSVLLIIIHIKRAVEQLGIRLPHLLPIIEGVVGRDQVQARAEVRSLEYKYKFLLIKQQNYNNA